MSELSVGSLSGLAANSYVVDIASGSSLDLSNATDLPASALPAGSILQVVSTTKSDTFSASVATGGNSAVTGLSASITPSSTSSKILIHCVLGAAANDDGKNQVGLAIYDGSAFVDIAPASGSRTSVTTGGQTSGTGATNSVTMPSLMLLDSPATTSSITYSAYVINPRGGTQTLYVNRTENDSDGATSVRAVSTITLMEVAG